MFVVCCFFLFCFIFQLVCFYQLFARSARFFEIRLLPLNSLRHLFRLLHITCA